jgi:hypothetical protein
MLKTLVLSISIIAVFVFGAGSPCSGSSNPPAPNGGAHLNKSNLSTIQPVIIDFAKPQDPPLVKKFGLMNSGLVTMDHYRQDIGGLQLLKPESLRIDLSIGKGDAGWKEQIIAGSPENIIYHWREIDWLSLELNRLHVLPYWSFCYTPLPFQGKEGWRSAPNDLTKWSETAEAFSSHFRQAQIPVGYYEVWNEPDFPEFLRASRDDYFAMYRAASLALLKGNPDAVIGGPALAYSWWWISPFVDYVEQNQLPLDFFSFHSIGGAESGPSKEQEALNTLQAIRTALSSYPRFQSTEVHLSEYNPFRGSQAKFYPRHELAERMLDDFSLFLNQTDLTEVSWAQYMDPGPGDDCGVLHPDGKPKPAAGAFAIYSDMPIERVQAECADSVGCLASANRHQASVALWNKSDEDQDISVQLHDLPFDPAHLILFRIDSQNDAAALKNGNLVLQPVETTSLSKDQTWRGLLPARSVVYLKLVKNIKADMRITPPGRLLRTRCYYPDRGKSWYAYFDRASWSMLLGTGQETNAIAAIGLVLDNSAHSIRIRTDFSGNNVDKIKTSFAIRVDYQTKNGLLQSVLLCDKSGKDTPFVKMPWETRDQPERQVTPLNIADFRFKPSLWASHGWTGQFILTPMLQNASANTRVRTYISGAEDAHAGQ